MNSVKYIIAVVFFATMGYVDISFLVVVVLFFVALV